VTKLRYQSFKNDIDIDAFEEAIGFEPIYQRGDNDVGKCPDMWGLHKHGDTTGKFAIHREKKVWHCWVCSGGDLLSLTMAIKDMDEYEATDWLSTFAQAPNEYHFMFEDAKARQTEMPYFNERVLDKFSDPTDWFYTRGISDKVIQDVGLRFSNLAMKPSPIKEINGNKEKKFEDYYGPAAIFPHFWNEKLVGWQYRWVDYGKEYFPKWIGKYTMTMDFPKAHTLYNYDYASQSDKPIVVVESIPVVLMLRSFDIPAVCYFGSQITDSQLRLLRKFHQGVILSPDNDSVGRDLVAKANNYLNKYIPVSVTPPVPGDKSDLGDFVNSNIRGSKSLEEAVRDHLSLARELEIFSYI